jgi:hypothetical protein
MEKTQRERFLDYVKELKQINEIIEAKTVQLDENGLEVLKEDEIVETTPTIQTTDDILADLIQTLIEKNII